MKSTALIAISAAAWILASCENPADKTTSAAVTDAVQTTSSPATAGGVQYRFTPESEINFIGSKVTGSHTGGFKSFTGGFRMDGNTLVGTGQKITIDMNSLWSDDGKLTGHLKSGDFFDVEKYPESSFELTGLKAVSENGFEVSGNLTLTGTTRNITFPATASLTDGRAKIHAKFDINRKDFGIVYAGMADDLIRDEVVIELKLEAATQA
jgi:polyisoprenoid-binding protein YceI